MEKCRTCSEYVYNGGVTLLGFPHACPPRWCVEIEGEDEPRMVYARGADTAAEMVAESYDEGGTPTILNGSPLHVVVTGPDGKRYRFSVEGEVVPQYTAHEVREAEDAP